MEEADQLADMVTVIDGGKVIAKGTADDLKAKVGADRLEIIIGRKANFKKAQAAIQDDSLQVDEENRTLSVASKHGVKTLKEVLHKLESAKIDIENISLHRPTLDDVFLTLTGHVATQATEESTQKTKGKK